MTDLAFPNPGQPEVSILMPTYGGWSFVQKALTALLENTDPCYELIVVDDASPDDLPERLRSEVAGARIILSDRNRGFGPTINDAADLARGRALVLLNSDAFVHPGWLPPLLEHLERDDVGVVSPKVLNVDGTLQEAGCVIFSNANTWFYGFGDDPDGAAYRHGRDVDYASASCLLVRRRAFFDVGGLSPVYAPAYFEDVELCLSLREMGWRCLYEPRSRVTHIRNASTNPEVSARSWERNAAIFRERWASFLETRPPFAPPEEPGWGRRQLAARDAAASSRVLIITERSEDWAAGRGDPRCLAILLGLASRTPRTSTTLLALQGELDSLETARAMGIETAFAPGDAERWLHERRFHYDVVFVQGWQASRRVRSSLESSQPQAEFILDIAGFLGDASRRDPDGGGRGGARTSRDSVQALEETFAATRLVVSRPEEATAIAAWVAQADVTMLSAPDEPSPSTSFQAQLDELLARSGVAPRDESAFDPRLSSPPT